MCVYGEKYFIKRTFHGQSYKKNNIIATFALDFMSFEIY